jgi:hypothetical protein
MATRLRSFILDDFMGAVSFRMDPRAAPDWLTQIDDNRSVAELSDRTACLLKHLPGAAVAKVNIEEI